MRIMPIAVPQRPGGRRISDDRIQHRTRLRDYGIAVFLLTGLADALFFDALGRPVGLSVPLFGAILSLAVVVCHRRLIGRHLAPYSLLLTIALLALIENVDWKSLTMAIACLACFSLATARRLPSGLDAALALGRFLAFMPIALPDDLRRGLSVRRRSVRRGSGSPVEARALLVWVMPLVLTIGFVLLLGAGNPILEQWLSLVDQRLLVERLDSIRIVFWVIVSVCAWPFLRPRLHGTFRQWVAARLGKAETAIFTLPAWMSVLGGRAAVLRALILFNAVFAVQTLLDVTYLWGGLKLPQGVDYAAYAHRGAYTLIAAALLAAAFVLLALRPDTSSAGDRRIRTLVYLWIGQSVVLVLSAMLRLDLYVDVYALTQWRLAAFVWMGIVATGLVLICLRIAWRRSGRWLMGANMTAVAIVFAGSCFVDPEALIARFNVEHSQEMSGEGVRLDVDHLASLGPAAIPAIDEFLAHAGNADAAMPDARSRTIFRLSILRDDLAERHHERSERWHAWTVRGWRLTRYLEASPIQRTAKESLFESINAPK